MALRNDMHSGVGQNLEHGFDGADSEPGIGGEESQHLDQYLVGRINVASGGKIVKPLDLVSLPVPRVDQGNPVKRVGENRAHSAPLKMTHSSPRYYLPLPHGHGSEG